MTRPPNASVQTRAVLGVFAAQEGVWRHGYDIARETGLKPGTLYPMLKRLDEHGLLEAMWRPPLEEGRPPRHVYRLTEAGLAFARAVPTAPAPAAARASPPRPRTVKP
jgi:DNA-binding PadR family transcriptional regulator